MTTTNQPLGRPAASRFPAFLRLTCAILFGLAALPACAQQAPAAATDAPAAQPAPLPMPPALDASLALSPRAPVSEARKLVAAAQPAADAGADDDKRALGSRIQSVLQRALTLLGTPYRWGGTTTDGFDCSGLVGYVFRTTLGIELPRVSRDMARSGQLIADRALLAPGDLVFFARRAGGKVDHVGIYLGEGQFVHAPRTGKAVEVSSLDNNYWNRRYIQARRVAQL
ncbi:MAG TPA: C40 family peptidase [Xanthomonadaceae bacterium]|nr:C40 family peptidase [Xanthomonadaceae bacterium]